MAKKKVKKMTRIIATVPHSVYLQFKRLHDNPNSAFDRPEKKPAKKLREIKEVIDKYKAAIKRLADKYMPGIVETEIRKMQPRLIDDIAKILAK